MFAVSSPRLPSVHLARITATNPRLPSSLSLTTTTTTTTTTTYPRLSPTIACALKRPLIPTVRKSGDGVLSHFFKEHRIIYIIGEITEEKAAIINSQILHLEAMDDEKPIRLFIDSMGGTVSSGFSIHDTITTIKPQVRTLCVGRAFNIASVVLAAGAIGHRWALPSSRIMLSLTHLKTTVDELMAQKELIRNCYTHHCNKSKEEEKDTYLSKELIETMLEKDTYLSAEEAVKFGIVDRVKRGSYLHL